MYPDTRGVTPIDPVLHPRPGSRRWSSGQGRKLEQSKGQGEFQLVKMVKIGPKVDFRWVWPHFL